MSAASADTVNPPQNKTSNEVWVLVTSVLASAMAFIDATALNVAMPAIQSQINATGPQMFWIVNSYAVVTAALILFGGALGDGFGRKRIFAIGIALFTLASLGCGLARGIHPLIATRALQGCGAALMIPGSLSMIATVFAPDRRGRAIGIWSACSVVMTALGPIIGGLLADAGQWPAIFFINLPIGVIALTALLWKVSLPTHADQTHDGPADGSHRSDQRKHRVDLAGAVYSILALSGINFALLEVGSRGWNDVVVVAALGFGVISLVCFLRNESRAEFPLLPMDVFRRRNFNLAAQMTLSFYSGLYGMLFFLSLNLVQVQGYRASMAGAAQLPVMVLVVVLSPVAGSLVDRRGPRLPLTIGGVLGTIGFLLLASPATTSGESDYWTTFFPPLVCLGAAMGMVAATLSTTIMNSVSQSRVGIASGINSTLSRLSNVLGVALLGPVALFTFGRSLNRQCGSLPVPDAALHDLRADAIRLGDTVPPTGISPDLSKLVQDAILLAQVDSFRAVSILSALAVALSTLITVLLLERKHVDE